MNFRMQGLCAPGGWLDNIKTESPRIAEVNVETVAARHFHASVLTFVERFGGTAETHSNGLFVKVAEPLRVRAHP
jgi:hypothetical protein